MPYQRIELSEGDDGRIVCTPLIWMLYAIGLCVKMKDLEWCKQNYEAYVGISVAWFVIVSVSQLRMACHSLRSFSKQPYNSTWLNLPLMTYIVCFLPVYCLALHFFHKDGLMTKANYILLQTMMPIVVIGNITYPLPRRPNRAASTAIKFLGFLNAFDIMDVVSDFEYIVTYNDSTVAWFYVSVVISIILLAFPIGPDEEDEDDPECGRILKTCASLVFTDISFCVLRSIVMIKEDSLIGLVFAYKNAISAVINVDLLRRAINEENR